MTKPVDVSFAGAREDPNLEAYLEAEDSNGIPLGSKKARLDSFRQQADCPPEKLARAQDAFTSHPGYLDYKKACDDYKKACDEPATPSLQDLEAEYKAKKAAYEGGDVDTPELTRAQAAVRDHPDFKRPRIANSIARLSKAFPVKADSSAGGGSSAKTEDDDSDFCIVLENVKRKAPSKSLALPKSVPKTEPQEGTAEGGAAQPPATTKRVVMAHQLPKPRSGARSKFDIPEHTIAQSEVLDGMRKEAEEHSRSNATNAWMTSGQHYRRFVASAAAESEGIGRPFDGGPKDMAYMLAKHGKGVLMGVLDKMNAVPEPSAKSQQLACDAFLKLIDYTKLNMAGVSDYNTLHNEITNIATNVCKRKRKSLKQDNAQCKAMESVETFTESGKWMEWGDLEKVGKRAWVEVKEARTRFSDRSVACGRNDLSAINESVMVVMILGTQTGRQGAFSQISAADMDNALKGSGFVQTAAHKNARHSSTPISSMEIPEGPVRDTVLFYRDHARPMFRNHAKTHKGKDGSTLYRPDSNADVTGHFWVNTCFSKLDPSVVFKRGMKRLTKGMGPEGTSLDITTTTVRKMFATKLQDSVSEGKLTTLEADAGHRGDGHSAATAVRFYAGDEANRRAKEASKVLKKAGMAFLQEDSGGGATGGRPTKSLG